MKDWNTDSISTRISRVNMQVLKRSRKQPQVGDIFVYKIRRNPYGYGRVIRLDAKLGGFSDVTLLYFFRAFSKRKAEIPVLNCSDLLIPPLGTNHRGWSMGYFETIENRPLESGAILPIHCFWSDVTSRYRNEYGKVLPRKHEPCGLFALDSFRTIDVQLSMALGIEPSPDTAPDRR